MTVTTPKPAKNSVSIGVIIKYHLHLHLHHNGSNGRILAGSLVLFRGGFLSTI
jgi:hypothetical protein